MSYKLKSKELAFQVTREGKFEYRRYKHGETYNEVPPEDAHRFEKTQGAERIAQSEKIKEEKTQSAERKAQSGESTKDKK